MKSHDFGQFLFNNKILTKSQIAELIETSKKSKPKLATEALFLQLVSAAELVKDDDEFVRSLITPRQAARAMELKDGQSLWLAQGLIDNGMVDYTKLENILEKYYELQIPPLESMLTTYYENLKNRPDIDFPFAVDIIRNFHAFLSETLHSTIVILPQSDLKNQFQIGASVKIIGEVPVVVALFADENVFVKLAKRYDEYVEVKEDSFDAISELLNVFTGHFVVKVAVTRGLDEEPEPPRYGNISSDFDSVVLMSDIGTFYIYIGKQEIFN